MAIEITVNLLFAILYLAQPGSVANARPGSLADAFFFSLETLATVGYGTMSPATPYGHIVSALEIFSGMALTAVLTGLLFVRFSRPKSRILYSTRAVVALRNGIPTLMLRLGNGRTTMLTHMSAKLSALLSERTSEGQLFRRTYELPLVRAEMQMFMMTWTLMHPIDASSPLHSYDAERLAREDVRLFLSFEARDQSLGVQVHDVKGYGPDAIRFGERFVDVISYDETGRPIADLTLLDIIEPDPAWTNSPAELPLAERPVQPDDRQVEPRREADP